jgi:hypothetical protein
MVTIESNREGSLLTNRPRERMADAPDTRQFRQLGADREESLTTTERSGHALRLRPAARSPDRHELRVVYQVTRAPVETRQIDGGTRGPQRGPIT